MSEEEPVNLKQVNGWLDETVIITEEGERKKEGIKKRAEFENRKEEIDGRERK